MNSGRRCPFYRAVDDHAVNSAISGGFPHSEIHGSKPITGSPWLIAGYHVLHRLLLPRHPPRALLALDPIQKKLDFFRSQEAGASHARRWPGKFGVLDLERQLPSHTPKTRGDSQATSCVALSSRFQDTPPKAQPAHTAIAREAIDREVQRPGRMAYGGAYQI